MDALTRRRHKAARPVRDTLSFQVHIRYPYSPCKSIFLMRIFLKGCIGDGVGAMRKSLREIDRALQVCMYISYVCILVEKGWMRIIDKRQRRFRGLKRPRRDLMKRAAAFTSSRPARQQRPSRHRIGRLFPGNRIVGPGGIRRIRSGRTRPNLVMPLANWRLFIQSPFMQHGG